MRKTTKLKTQRKNFFSSITYVLDAKGIIGTLRLPLFNNSAFYSGIELYSFYPIDVIGNSYRIYRGSKSIGYIHLHYLRNMAQINLVDEGPFQFSLRGIFQGNWVLRQGKISLEKIDSDLIVHSMEPEVQELLIACGIFTSAKINKDLAIYAPIILLIWVVFIFI